jgi:tRNA A-37 threonylcarbamoyl transferase component Bud32
MSQHDHHWDRTRTLTGFSRPAVAPPPAAAAAKRPAIYLGAPVGRSGDVFEAGGDAGAGQRVIKLFRRASRPSPEVVARFTREVMTVANLRHPHVVQVVEAGTLADGTPFVVMERLAGETLAEAAEGRPLPTLELVSILRGVASALSAAHAAGVAHGAISAENVFLVDVPGYSHGFPRLLDFGAAGLAPSSRGLADARADQRALAELACRLLTGANTLADETTDPRCPPVYRVLARALADQAEQRFDSVSSFFQALQATLLASGSELTSPATAPTSVAPPSSLTQQFFAEGERQERAAAAVDEEDADDSLTVSGAALRLPRRRAPMIGAAAIALGSLAIVGFTVVSLSRAHHPTTWTTTASAPPPAPVPEAKAAAPVTARTRTTVRRPRLASNAVQPGSRPIERPTEPAPLAPIGAPSATPAASPAPAAAAAPPATPSDDDFTKPSEETEAAPIPGQPVEAPPPTDTPASSN